MFILDEVNMKRFNLFRIIFALVCGCHIIGVQSNRRRYGIYEYPIGICKAAPYDDQSSVVQLVTGLDTCGAADTTLNVIKDEYPGQIDSIDNCQKRCQSLEDCTDVEYDKINKKCLTIGKKSYGTRAKHIVTGYGKCPKIGKCPYVGIDYTKMGYGRKFDVYSPKECQTYCRRTYGSTALIDYGFYHKLCYCKKAFNIGIDISRTWISGPTRCSHCYGYTYNLRKLQNVYNGSPNPFLIMATVEACQLSCEKNPLCLWFEFDPWTGKCYHKNPLTARMMKCNAAYASRYCNGIVDCPPCNPKGVINGVQPCGLLGNCHCNKQQGYTGRDCYSCLPGYYMVNNECFPCNCDQYGSKSQSCHTSIPGYGIGQCPCWFDSYEGRQCATCVKGQRKANGRCCYDKQYHDLGSNRCRDCDCDRYGSKNKGCNANTGQCPCWFDSYTGRRCHNCVKGQRKLHGRCCWNYQWFDTSEKRCKDCVCNRARSTCDGSTGNCRCKWRYKGRNCDVVNRDTAFFEPNGRLGKPVHNSEARRWYLVLEHECHTSCDLRYIEVKSYGVDIDIWGSTAKWSTSNGWFTTSGTKFCHKTGSSTTSETCKGAQSALKGHKIFWLLLYSHNYFSNSKYYYELGNAYSVLRCWGFC